MKIGTSKKPVEAKAPSEKEAAAHLSQGQLIWKRFSKHRLGRLSLDVLICFYLVAIFAEFFAPINPQTRDLENLYCPPQLPSLSFSDGFHAHAMIRQTDPETLRHVYRKSDDHVVPLKFFAKGDPYKLWGLLTMERHFIGINHEDYRKLHGPDAEIPIIHLLGADKYGRDIFARVIYGSRISLSIGLVSIAITLLLGISIGGISGYVGGALDNALQRGIEILNSFPQTPSVAGIGSHPSPGMVGHRHLFRNHHCAEYARVDTACSSRPWKNPFP